MILVEKHQYSRNSEHYKELDNLCFLSKNLYNASLYQIRQHYFKTKEYLSYKELNKMSNDVLANDYRALPRKVAQQTQKLVDQNFKSFFEHLKVRKEGEHISIPKYLDKVKGRQVLTYTKQAISQNNSRIEKGYVKLSGVSFKMKTNVEQVTFARVVPKKNYIVIELGYETQDIEEIPEFKSFASIDIGVNNLATVTSNVFEPFIVNGRPLKSINQFYNKRIAELSSENKGEWTNRMYAINRKRTNKMNDYMHKSSRHIVNQLVETGVDTLIIGHNKEWKQDTTMQKKDKQNFIQIPFNTFIDMLSYKCKLSGIRVITQEESYTSKCSFLDKDYIPTYGVDDAKFNPSGKRVKRGLYRTKDFGDINADVNGSYNIMRKYLTKKVAWNETTFSDCVEVCSTPVVYTVKL